MELTRSCPTNKKGRTIYSLEGKYSPFHCTNKMSGNHSIMAGCCLSNRTEENGPLSHDWTDRIGVIQTVDLQKNKSGWSGKIYKPLLSSVMKSRQRKQSFRWHAAIILENESVLCWLVQWGGRDGVSQRRRLEMHHMQKDEGSVYQVERTALTRPHSSPLTTMWPRLLSSRLTVAKLKQVSLESRLSLYPKRRTAICTLILLKVLYL